MLEPYTVKVVRTVLRGEGGRESPDLPGLRHEVACFYCWTRTRRFLIQTGMVLPVPEPGGRRWQRRGLKHRVRGRAVSCTPGGPWGMVGMGNVSEALVLRIVKAAELDAAIRLQSQTCAELVEAMALPGRLASIDGEPTHP